MEKGRLTAASGFCAADSAVEESSKDVNKTSKRATAGFCTVDSAVEDSGKDVKLEASDLSDAVDSVVWQAGKDVRMVDATDITGPSAVGGVKVTIPSVPCRFEDSTMATAKDPLLMGSGPGARDAKATISSADFDPKRPLFSKASADCARVMAKVEEWSSAVLQQKKQYATKNLIMPRISKVALLRTTSSDTRMLAEYSEAILSGKNAKECGTAATPPFARCCIRPTRKISQPEAYLLLSRTQKKKIGMDLIKWKDSFAVPSAAVCGNVYLDSMNFELRTV